MIYPRNLSLCLLVALLLSSCASPNRPLFGRGRIVDLSEEGSPLVAFRVAFLSGSVDDPRGKEGLTRLTARLYTENKAFARASRELAAVGGAISLQVDKELTVFYGQAPKEHAGKLSALLCEVLLQPAFTKEGLRRLREEALTDLSLLREDDDALARAVLEAMVYEGHPYAHPVLGTEAGIGAVTLTDVKEHAGRVFSRDRMLVGAFGEDAALLAKNLVEGLLALPEKGAPRQRLPALKKRDRPRVSLIEADREGVTIVFGFPSGATRSDPDFPALELARSYLGEHRLDQGMLFQEISAARGLNDGDFAYLGSFVEEEGSPLPRTNIPRRQQLFSVWLRSTAPQNAVFAVKAALYTLDFLLFDGVPEESLAAVRGFLARYGGFTTRDPARRLGFVMDDRFYGRRWSYYERLPKILPKLDARDIDRALRKYLLGRQGVQIVMIAKDVESLRAKFYAKKSATVEYASPPSPALLEEDALIGAYDLNILLSDIHILKASKLFVGASLAR